ncbi:MAG: class I SAM-dependent methyltransferase [Candidatus Cloacimonetes bacterium]|nr:class I SAM-dependent methyltransferase [Candidatus Cloacimonadota bacterium]
MKLRLFFDFAREAEIVEKSLKFFPEKEQILLQAEKEGEKACPVYLSLKGAVEQTDARAGLHICRDFGLFWGDAPKTLSKLAKHYQLYRLADDNKASEVLQSLPSVAVGQMHDFWAIYHPQKLLVLGSRLAAELIFAIDPAAFIHLIFGEKGHYYSLAAEHFGYRSLWIGRNLSFLCQLCAEGDELDLADLPHNLRSLENPSYSFFAEHYDSYMSHVSYENWVNSVHTWQKQYAKRKGKKALELACGTANISNYLVAEGYTVDACDISLQMLSIADKKELKPNLYQAALTDEIPGRDYDLILCLFDSINYLDNKIDIITCLNEVHKALAVGGLFIFDISTLMNSQEYFSEMCNYQFDNKSHLVHEAYYEHFKHRQISRLSCFEKRGCGYLLMRENHQQRVYFSAELVDIISRTQLRLIAIRTSNGKQNLLNKRLSSLDESYPRLFFILRKDA